MLPFFEYRLTDDVEGLSAIALVEAPATGVNYQAFAPQKFEVLNEEKRIVVGAAMIPDLPIYRRDERGEYYAIFKKETINQLVQKYFKEQKTTEFNEMHDPLLKLEGVYLYQSFITDKELGIHPPKGFENVADGTWFIAAKVENDDAWSKVKQDGLLKGFSVEGFFDIQPYKFNKMSKLDKVINLLRSSFGEELEQDGKKKEEDKDKMAEATLVDGTVVIYDGELAEGTAIVIVTEEGEVSAPDGTHELTSGEIITTAGGLVTEVVVSEELDSEFTEENLQAAIGKALGLWSKELKLDEKFEAITKENEELKAQVANFAKIEETLKADFNKTMQGIGSQLEELAKTEDATAQKPSSFAKMTRQEKASKMASLIKAQKKIK
jgi:hypothetical protein